MTLLDANLLTRMTRSHDPQCALAREAIQKLLAGGERVGPENGRSTIIERIGPVD